MHFKKLQKYQQLAYTFKIEKFFIITSFWFTSHALHLLQIFIHILEHFLFIWVVFCVWWYFNEKDEFLYNLKNKIIITGLLYTKKKVNHFNSYNKCQEILYPFCITNVILFKILVLTTTYRQKTTLICPNLSDTHTLCTHKKLTRTLFKG